MFMMRSITHEKMQALLKTSALEKCFPRVSLMAADEFHAVLQDTTSADS
jgi:hypothetical protein